MDTRFVGARRCRVWGGTRVPQECRKVVRSQVPERGEATSHARGREAVIQESGKPLRD